MSTFTNINNSTENNVLTIKTVQIAPFRTLMTALKDILLETNITFEADGIRIINMDKSHTILAHLHLAAHNFEFYECKKEKIIIGGHLDSWDLATGAMDNGIGSFTILDIARVFQSLNLRPKRTIEFVMFMGEEQGLLGSKAMVKKYKEEGKIDQVQLMVNLDMVNNAKGFNAMGRPELRKFFDEIGKKIKEVDSTFTNVNQNSAGLHSDHQPFMIEGVPVCSPSGNFPVKAYNCYHANCDRFDLIDKKQIGNNVRFTAMMLYALAEAEALPVKKMNDQETKEFLIKQNLKNELIIGKDWRWEQ